MATSHVGRPYMSYRKTTVKFSSSPTISFSRKSTLNVHYPDQKWQKNQAIVYTCSAYHSATHAHVCCQTATRKLRFHAESDSVLLSANISMTQLRKPFLWNKKMHKGGHRPKSQGLYPYARNPYHHEPCSHCVCSHSFGKAVRASENWYQKMNALATQGLEVN